MVTKEREEKNSGTTEGSKQEKKKENKYKIKEKKGKP